MRVIVAGSRDFTDYDRLCSALDRILAGRTVEIVSGHARGADELGERYARERGHSLRVFPADWNTHGRAAGPIRNEAMAAYATHAVVFWDGESRGSRHMIDTARAKGLPLRVVRV